MSRKTRALTAEELAVIKEIMDKGVITRMEVEQRFAIKMSAMLYVWEKKGYLERGKENKKTVFKITDKGRALFQ